MLNDEEINSNNSNAENIGSKVYSREKTSMKYLNNLTLSFSPTLELPGVGAFLKRPGGRWCHIRHNSVFIELFCRISKVSSQNNLMQPNKANKCLFEYFFNSGTAKESLQDYFCPQNVSFGKH